MPRSSPRKRGPIALASDNRTPLFPCFRTCEALLSAGVPAQRGTHTTGFDCSVLPQPFAAAYGSPPAALAHAHISKFAAEKCECASHLFPPQLGQGNRMWI